MTREELERRLDEAEKQNLGLLDEIKNLKAQMAEQDKQEIPDSPNFECGESYWTMFDNFALSDERTAFVRDATDYNRFHTEAYAQEFSKKCKLIAMMLHCKWYLCRDFKGDYSCPNDKWVVYYSGTDNKFLATNSIHCDYGFIPFDTLDNAEKCSDWMNVHWKESTEAGDRDEV